MQMTLRRLELGCPYKEIGNHMVSLTALRNTDEMQRNMVT